MFKMERENVRAMRLANKMGDIILFPVKVVVENGFEIAVTIFISLVMAFLFIEIIGG